MVKRNDVVDGSAFHSPVQTVDGDNEITGAVPIIAEATVDASGGGSGEETTLFSLVSGDIILNVWAEVETAFDGDTTTTLEVGVSGNTDAYIDTVDFDPSSGSAAAQSLGGTNNDETAFEVLGSDTDVIATWTNTANASAGEVTARIAYLPTGARS